MSGNYLTMHSPKVSSLENKEILLLFFLSHNRSSHLIPPAPAHNYIDKPVSGLMLSPDSCSVRLFSSDFTHLEQRAEISKRRPELTFEGERGKVRIRNAAALYNNSSLDASLCGRNKTKAEDSDCLLPFSAPPESSLAIFFLFQCSYYFGTPLF